MEWTDREVPSGMTHPGSVGGLYLSTEDPTVGDGPEERNGKVSTHNTGALGSVEWNVEDLRGREETVLKRRPCN